jgi:hypothetical protein
MQKALIILQSVTIQRTLVRFTLLNEKKHQAHFARSQQIKEVYFSQRNGGKRIGADIDYDFCVFKLALVSFTLGSVCTLCNFSPDKTTIPGFYEFFRRSFI